MSNVIDKFFDAKQEVFDYFGYVEDWVVIPLEDMRNVYWYLDGEDFDSTVHFTYSKTNMEFLLINNFDYDLPGADPNDYYTYEVYTQRFLPKWVYRTEDYTMICVDTHTDGNKFLSVFDNAKNVK